MKNEVSLEMRQLRIWESRKQQGPLQDARTAAGLLPIERAGTLLNRRGLWLVLNRLACIGIKD